MSFFPSLLAGGLLCFHLGWGGELEKAGQTLAVPRRAPTRPCLRGYIPASHPQLITTISITPPKDPLRFKKKPEPKAAA